MGKGIHLSRQDMLEHDSIPKHRTRKLENPCVPSVLVKKLEPSGRKVAKGHVIGELSSSYLNTNKFFKQVLDRNRTEAFWIRSSRMPDKASNVTGPTTKRKEDGGSVSFSTDITHSKVRKLGEGNITSGAADRKSEDGDKKATRKHLHARTYKNLFIKHAIKGGSQGVTDECIKEKRPLHGVLIDLGENTSQEVNGGKGQGSKEDDLQVERELCVKTMESLKKKESRCTKLFTLALDASSLPETINEEHQIKFSGSKCEKNFTPNLKSVNLLESSEEEMDNHDLYRVNMDSPSSILEVSRWRKEWAEPERLLQKRLIVPREVTDEHTSLSVFEPLNCCNEWFVKWKGLPYDQATWELEDSLLLLSSESPRLIEDYERRHEHARKTYDPQRTEKSLQVKKVPFCKLSKLPDGCPVELDKDYLGSVNSLREFWYKSLNAVLIDCQEHITKSILFVLSLQSHACRPSLIVTSSGSLHLWQAEFSRLAPSVDVIMYQGDKDVRKMIQNVEFYDNQGRLMFQVLLSDPMAIVEDLDDIACIGWESLILDNSQNSNITRYHEQLNTINIDFILVLFNGQLEDSLSEYRLLLSFLNNKGIVEDGLVGLKVDNIESPVALTTFKEKLTHHIANECEFYSSKFIEYWVAVPLSSVQLEQYCATLFSNGNVLRSNSRSDVIGVLHNILIATRKCCDHPYLVEGELRGLLTKGLQGVEVLNAEVCASGKLYLLGKILQEMKDHGLRVVILYQTLGELGKVSLGDILDDFLQQQFGENSYERIENGMIMTKKVAAVKKFNSKEAGIFAFLLEKRACLPSVKLQSVDVVVLFNSDWNPLNDLRSLQKIGIGSPHNSIKVFRLYSSYTVEEKILILAKQDTILENSIHSISYNIIHSLLGWGASYLFRELDLLHSNASPTCLPEASFGNLCLNDVISEILAQLHGNVEINRTVPCSILMKARLIGGTYSNNIVLVGEKEDILLPDKDLPRFWSGLLDGRHPKWMHISGQSQRIHKRIQNVNGLVIQSVESGEVKNKRQKINNIADSTMLPGCSQEILTNNNVASASLPECFQGNIDLPKEVHGSCMVDSEGRELKFEDQRNLLLLLRPELLDLCDILGLPESVKSTAEEFLVYIMNNHDVSLDQVTVLQALKISLCWQAASMLRHKLDHIESLAIAKDKLKFECTEREARSVYSKLKIMNEKHSFQLDSLKVQCIQNSQSSLSKTADIGSEHIHGRAKETASSDNSALGVVGGFPFGSQNDHCLIDEVPGKSQYQIESLKDDLLKSQIDLVEQVFLRRLEDLVQRQQAEVANFDKQVHDDRMKLENAHHFDLDLICAIHVDSMVRYGKVGVLTQVFSNMLGGFDQHVKQQKEKLLSMQLDIRNKEKELKHSWLHKAKTNKMDESFNDLPRLEISFRLERFSEYVGNKNSESTNANFACPSIEENTVSQGCLQVSSVALNGQEEFDKIGDEVTSTSLIVNSVEQVKQNGACVEPSPLPELTGVHLGISAPQADLNTFNTRLTGSVIEEDFDFEELQDRDGSSSPHLIPNPELIQGELVSSLQVLENSVPSSSSSSIQCISNNSSHHPSGHAEVHVQDALEPAIVETEPSVQQIPEDTFHPVRPQDDPPLERTCSAHLEGTDIQQGQLNQLFQNSLSIEWVPLQAIYADLMQNELLRIQKQDCACTKKHENKKLQLQLECEREFEEVRRKYGALLQGAERDYLSDKMVVEGIHHKVSWHKAFAEEVRAKFFNHNEGLSTPFQVQIQNSSQHLQASPSVPQLPSRRSPTLPPPVLPSTSTTNLASTVPSIPTVRPRSPALPTRSMCQTPPPLISTHTLHVPITTRPTLQPQLSFRPSPGPPSPIPPSTSTTNLASTLPSIPPARPRSSSLPIKPSSQTSSPMSTHTLHGPTTSRPAYQVGRSPAPHLQCFRPHAVFTPAIARPSASIGMTASVTPTCGFSQPSVSSHFSAPLLELPQDCGADGLLESLLADFPATGEELPAVNAIHLRPNASCDVISLSDEE